MARGSGNLPNRPDPSPTLLLGIDDSPSETAGVFDKHRRAVECLAAALSEEDEGSEYSGDSMDESEEDDDEDMDLTEEVDDSTTLGHFQDGIRKESLARKASISQMVTLKKGRGTTGRDKINRIRRIMRENHVDLFALVETRANEDRILRLCNQFARVWNWVAIPANGYSGGIIVFWLKHLGKITPVAHSHRALHLVFSSFADHPWIISVVYNAQHLKVQQRLWNELSSVSKLDLPCIVLGDFNAITSSVDHKECGLARRWARLDRCLVNDTWLACSNSIHLKYLPKIFSDHSPMLISIMNANRNFFSVFRFENYWLEHANYVLEIRKALFSDAHSNPMHAFFHVLARVRRSVCAIRHLGLGALDKEIKSIEVQLQALEVDDRLSSCMDPVSFRELQNRYRALLRQYHSRWAQKSRLNWVMSGDMNSAFFHRSVRVRRHHNSISSISDNKGGCFNVPEQIEQVFLDHFSTLWNSADSRSTEQVLEAIPPDLPTLTYDQQTFLSKTVTKDEIYATLLSLPVGKSPGPDGMNVEFYKFFWNDLEKHLVPAILYFFEKVVMPGAWGRTYITLIPKREHPKFVSDFRPISLCNVAYKIVTKILANRLKNVIACLVGKEQCGFVPGRSPVDNIIAVQEMIHTINQDRTTPPRMILKVDIEKAYDTINWNIIYATLIKMNFPSIWISYIRACLEASSYSILLNGKPSVWFCPHRGIRQGDPLSPYIFILVAQNLTTILNHARFLGLIPGFSNSLTYNFNHLMYADDLILISSVTRRAARNIVFCLNLYAHLAGQVPNQMKSEVFFPHWFNKRVSNRICNILNVKHGKTPFLYLGVLISPKRLALAQFDSMVTRLNRAVDNWGKVKLSKAGKSILINSILMSTPIYYLAVYPIPDSILAKISLIARKYLWANYDHGSGMPLVNWDTITSSRSEGGLGIRNLLKVKHSLMAKNLFNLLNKHENIWVDIVCLKYGDFNFWTMKPPPNCSAFFRGLCYNANVLKPFLWINCLNPSVTSFLYHPWLFETPLAFKPVFLNMNIFVDDFQISELLDNDSWNLDTLNCLFGTNWNSPIISFGKICHETDNHWVWFPATCSNRLSSNIYKFLNKNSLVDQQWCGWSNIWKLAIAPKAKSFIWLLMHGKLKTYDYLYRLNLGPPDPCVFCGLTLESSNHLFRLCNFSIRIWQMVESLTNCKPLFLNALDTGEWLDFNVHGNSKSLASITAATLWQIWISRCNKIFRQDNPDISKIANLIMLHVKDFSTCSANFLLRNYMMNNRPRPGFLGVLSAAAWNNATGFCPAPLAVKLELDLQALCWALQRIVSAREKCSNIYTSSVELWRMLILKEDLVSWRQCASLDYLVQLLNCLNQPHIESIPQMRNRSTAMAIHGCGLFVFSFLVFEGGSTWVAARVEALTGRPEKLKRTPSNKV
ncbi:uncharacterized protein LOC120255989 [Dioscorea cayenensis subsp. rotundata]|uniref:Uncharacterized protein LOC120255989 n=1 Tax=Dioscorea cayennensis subsp. rotundata TaxID=55577 RepID=A0AB40AXH1_DIOCR|nr:uncharacterized protein LOC120255989 [Dioscorea cayenensis subsp. rotundata]